ncbi:hypothetical protein, partial [Escherichia coli]
ILGWRWEGNVWYKKGL